MTTKHMVKLLGAWLLGLAVSMGAQAQKPPQEGVDYQVLKTPQATDEKDKIEVIEFFWYSCPHCNQFEPVIEPWAKKLPADVAFKRVHVRFNNSFIPQQKLYLTLEALGKLDELHGKVFYAIHAERQRLTTDDQILEWAAKQGLDKKKFADTYNSFAVQTKANRFAKMQEAYRVDGVPMLAVNGQYVTSPSMAGGDFARSLQVVDFLIEKIRTQKKNGK